MALRASDSCQVATSLRLAVVRTPRSSQADGHASSLVTNDVVWPPVGTITQKTADGATNPDCTYIWDWTLDADFTWAVGHLRPGELLTEGPWRNR